MRLAFPRFAFFIFLVAVVIAAGDGSCSAQTKPQNREVTDTTKPVASMPRPGKFYALVIGINSYQHLHPLDTPLNDAKELAAVLGDQYGFETKLLLDASRDQIVGALDYYRHTLNESDSLLIYYAGHGFYDQAINEAYWAPVDAGQDTYARWIIATEITGTARAIPARHVLIISDSCYAGMLTRGRGADPEDESRSNYIEKMILTRSRTVMASGGDEPVSDSDAPGHFAGHSVFANVLLQSLSEIQAGQFTAEQLFVQVQELVFGRSKQKPEYSPIQDSTHGGGDFVFLRVHPGKVPEGTAIVHSEMREPPPIKPNADQEAVRAALDGYETAYASMDLRELKKVWPTLTRDQERELRSGFQAPDLKAVRVQLRNRTTKVDEGKATADCDQWMIYTFAGRLQPPQTSSVEIQLAKNNQGNWAVQSVRGK